MSKWVHVLFILELPFNLVLRNSTDIITRVSDYRRGLDR
jgi:hypothetical protein